MVIVIVVVIDPCQAALSYKALGSTGGPCFLLSVFCFLWNFIAVRGAVACFSRTSAIEFDRSIASGPYHTHEPTVQLDSFVCILTMHHKHGTDRAESSGIERN